MSESGEIAEVAVLPMCDICAQNGKGTVPASYDARTKSGPWAFLCSTHFGLYGTGLGIGKGQRLVVVVTKEQADASHPE